MAKSNNATSGNFFDGGNGRNVGLTNDLHDLEEFAKSGELGLLQQAGSISEEDAEKQMAEFRKENEAARSSDIAAVNTQSAINVAMNVGGLALSFAGAGASKAAGSVSKGTTAVVTETESAVKSVGGRIKDLVGAAGRKISNSQAAATIKDGFSKISGTAAGQLAKGGIDKLSSIAASIKSKVGSFSLNGATDDVARSLLGSGGNGVSDVLRGGKELVQNGSQAIMKGSNLTFNIAGDAYKASVLGTLKTTVAGAANTMKGSKGLLGVLCNTGKATAQVAVGTAQATGALASKFFSLGASKNTILKLVGNVGGVGIVTAPLITTQLVTRHISDEKTAELNGAIATLTAACGYYEDCGEDLTETQQKDHEALMESYDKANEELLEKYAGYLGDDGEFTDPAAAEAFYEEYKKISEDAAATAAKQAEGYKGFAEYATTEGVANVMAKTTMDRHLDVDATTRASDYAEEKLAAYPEALDSAKQYEAISKDLGDDGGFAGFIDRIHDTIVHYLPVAAYAEAAVKKTVDVVLSVLPIGYEEKYKGQGIGDLAGSIADSAEADYELRQEQAAIRQNVEGGIQDTVSGYLQRQEEERENDGGGAEDAYAPA